MAEIWGIAAAGVVGAVGGAIISGDASKSAAQTQANAAQNATNAQLSMFQTTQNNLAPYMSSGTNALSALNSGLGIGPNTGGPVGYGSLTTPFSPAQYQQSPGYSFQMGQGVQAVQNSASAAGGIGGGNTLKALTTFGQGLANSDYQQAYQNYVGQQQQQYGMLSGVANSGQNAAAGLGGISAGVGQSIGGNIIGAGNALAAGQVGSANAITGGVNSLTQLASLYGSGSYGSQSLNSSNGSINPFYAPQGGLVQAPQAGSPYVSYCDYGLKKNIVPMYFDGTSGLRVYEFHYKTQDDTATKWLGHIAHEVAEKYLDAVTLGPKGFLKVDYSKIPSSERYPRRVPSEEDWDEIGEIAGAFA